MDNALHIVLFQIKERGEPRKHVKFYGFVHFLTMLQLFFLTTDWRLFSISCIFYISKVLTKVCLRHTINRTKQQKYLIIVNMYLGFSREFWSNSTPLPFCSQIHSPWLGDKVNLCRRDLSVKNYEFGYWTCNNLLVMFISIYGTR